MSGKVSIFTMVLWVNPSLIKSLETAIHFIPGLRVSPQAAKAGFMLSVCQKTELYAEAVTSWAIHSYSGFWILALLVQDAITKNKRSNFFNRPLVLRLA